MNIWVPWFKLFNDISDFAELCGIGTTSYFGKYFCSSSLFSPLTRSSKQNKSNCNAFLFWFALKFMHWLEINWNIQFKTLYLNLYHSRKVSVWSLNIWSIHEKHKQWFSYCKFDVSGKFLQLKIIEMLSKVLSVNKYCEKFCQLVVVCIGNANQVINLPIK